MVTAGQAARIAAVSSSLGEDELLLRRLRAVEHVSRSFEFDLELLSENIAIKHEQLLGQRMTVRYELPGGGTRYFDGLVSQFSCLGGEGRYARYRARGDSWLWYLTRSSNCRIFQNKTVPQIVKEVFGEYPIAEFQDRLTATYRVWDYCVQYRETDYNFVNRLLEQEGIYYFFTHAKGKHTLILADRDSVPERISGYDRVPFYPPEDGGSRERDHISDWSVLQEVRSGSCVLRDFDFEKPRANLESRRQGTRQHALADLELYDYPGTYLTSDEGEVCSRKRLEETQADQEIVQGSGDVAGLIPGCAFTLTKYPRPDQNREYRVISTTFALTSDEYESRDTAGGGFSHHCLFTAIDSQRPYRPPRVTPKPTVLGPQTAIVTGPAGEEIWTDKYGRVKVQFHWDRQGKRDENSSCWVRVSHPWAGKGWGAIAIPRIGQEVIVEFLEGDPDRPIITGRVYNAEAMPPTKLPAQATMSGLKSNSTKGGGGFNALRFDDTKGSEQVLLEAEKELHTRVKMDTFETIGGARHLVITKDQFEQVKGSKHLIVVGDQNEKVNGTLSLTTGMDMQQKVGMKHAIDAGMEIHLKGGMNVVIEAGMSITLKAGAGFVVVGPAGVIISGTPVLINSGGAAGSGSGCSAEVPTAPEEATRWEPGQKSGPPPTQPPKALPGADPQAQALREAAKAGTPFCEKCEAARRAQAVAPGAA